MKTLILIIDDEQELSESMALTLRDNGYRVLCAEDSASGLRAAREQRPDLILCDVVMPDASGFETVCALRADPLTNRTPVVLITGDVEATQYAGDGKCLTLIKPFYSDTLVDVVRGTLAARGVAPKARALAACGED